MPDLPHSDFEPLTLDQRLALLWANERSRNAMTLLFQLDARLGGFVRNGNETGLIAIRLAWWRDQISSLGAGAIPSDPLLAECANLVSDHEVAVDDLVAIVDGWSALVNIEGAMEQADACAGNRSAGLFGALAHVMGVADKGRAQSEGSLWVLADLARSSRDPALRQAVVELGAAMDRPRLPPQSRGLAILAGLAVADLRRIALGQAPLSPRRRILCSLAIAWLGE